MTPPAPLDIRTAITKALVFDLGNVLIEIDFMRCVRYWSRRGRIPAAQIMARFKLDQHYEAFERGELSAGAYFTILRRQIGMALDDSEMAAGWNRIIREEKPGIHACIQKLKLHFPLYVLTNTNAVHAAEWGRRHSGLLNLFTRVFVSSNMGCRKPEAAVYKEVLDTIARPAEQVVFLDDTLANVEGAAAAGMQAIHVQHDEDIHALAHMLLAAHWSRP